MLRKWYRDENGVKHPIPAPRKRHLLGDIIPIPAPGTKIGEKRKALNGYIKELNPILVHWSRCKIQDLQVVDILVIFLIN